MNTTDWRALMRDVARKLLGGPSPAHGAGMALWLQRFAEGTLAHRRPGPARLGAVDCGGCPLGRAVLAC